VKGPEVATGSGAARSDRTRDAAPAPRIELDDPAASERPTVAQLLRTAADGVARKTYALELLADRTRGASQATVYKALQALEKERAIFSELSERVDTVDNRDWESFKGEALQALDAVREPDDESDGVPDTPRAPRRSKPAGSASAAAKH